MPFYITRRGSNDKGQTMAAIVDNDSFATETEAKDVAAQRYARSRWQIVEATSPTEAALRVGADPSPSLR